LIELAYYLHSRKFQPFAKFEAQNFAASANSKDVDRYGAGMNYYLRGQSLKWTLQYLRAIPRSAVIHSCHELTMQIQLFYF